MPGRSRRAARGCPGCGSTRAPRVGPPRHAGARRDRGVHEERLGVRRASGAVPARSPVRAELVEHARSPRAGPPRSQAGRSASSGSESCSSHLASRAAAPGRAATSASRSPTSPRNDPLRTSSTPGAFQPAVQLDQPGAGRRRPQHPAVQQARAVAGRPCSAAGPGPCRAGRAGRWLRPTATGRERAGGCRPRSRSVSGSERRDPGDVRRVRRCRPAAHDPADVPQGRAGSPAPTCCPRSGPGRGRGRCGPAPSATRRAAGRARRRRSAPARSRCPGRARPCRRAPRRRRRATLIQVPRRGLATTWAGTARPGRVHVVPPRGERPPR